MLNVSVEKLSRHSFSNYPKERVVLQQMVWPPHGPDLNIIEAVWEKRQPKSGKKNWQFLQDVKNNQRISL